MLTKLQHLTEATRDNWSNDPAARGAAKIAAGTALIAEAVFGLRSRAAATMRPNRDGHKQIHGIFGAVLGVILGTVFVVSGFWVAPSPSPDEVTAEGFIVDVNTGRNSDGDTMYTPVIEFTDGKGLQHRFTPGYSQGNRPSLGSSVTVGYSPDNPMGTARRTDGIAGYFHWIFIGTGALVTLGALFDLVIRLVMIYFGVKLVRSGRADRAAAGESAGGFFSDLMNLIRASNAGHIGKTGVTGNEQHTGGVLGVGNEAVRPHPVGPPPGFYADPAGAPGVERWWDGTTWTDHISPAGR